MPKRRGLGIWLVGAAGVLGVFAGAAFFWPRQGPATRPVVATGERLRDGKMAALAEAVRGIGVDGGATPKPFSEERAAAAVNTLETVRAGYAKFPAAGRIAAMELTGKVLARFAADPAPASWLDALMVSHGLLAVGMGDSAPAVRVAALAEVGRLWGWMPGRSLTPIEERALGEWKEGFLAPAVRGLADSDRGTRAAAVACLGFLPIDDAAAPAAAYVNDQDPLVRQQAVVSFAARRNLLSEEALLPLLHDRDAAVRLVSERALMARGLTADLIDLGKDVFHPRADRRAEVIARLVRREDIDPVVWLIHLSRDRDESVRSRALEAISGREITPEVGRRLREMAANDPSAAVRKAAAKLAPAAPPESTAALPPLPGSSSLNPKAN